MATITQFEDLKIWQEARLLVVDVYKFTKNTKDFDYNSQLRRAAVSVMNNIAEGFERSNNKEFIRFLKISKASCGEVRSMIYVANDLHYLGDVESEELLKFCFNLANAINKFIAYLENNLNK